MGVNKVVIQGTVQGTGEVWQTGCYVGNPGTGDSYGGPADLQTWADAIMQDLASTTTGIEPLKAVASTLGDIEGVAIYNYPNLGGPADRVGQSTLASVSGSGTVKVPPQISVCATLLTGLSGRSFRGRMYWPALGAAISTTTLKLTTPTPQDLATSFSNLLNLVADNQPGQLGLVPVVYSRTRSLLTSVTAVEVGDVLDTQRRRRDALIEVRSSAPL